MKKVILFILFTVMITQNSCLLKKKKLDKLWFYTYTSGATQNEDGEATPASFMYLQPDGSYTRDFGSFDYGHWKRKDSILLLSSSKGAAIVFPIKHLFGNELELVSAKGSILNFESQPARFSSVTDNPFSIENNQWRIPAREKESEQQLKDRLRNHCRFQEAYFKWALNDQLNSIDVRSTPSPIKIYGNGFALKEFDALPIAWRSYFYDEEDCQKANNILKNIFEKGDIGWSHTDNRYKMFISAFQQLQQQLK
jgi:hypothetical protein